MAVSLNVDALKLLKEAGGNTAAFEAAKAWGLKVQPTLTAIKFVGPDGEVITQIKGSLAELKASPTTAFKMALAVAETQVKAAGKKYAPGAPSAKAKDAAAASQALFAAPGTPALDLLAKNSSGPSLDPTASYPVLEPSNSTDKVPLREASGLYRPVAGTDETSRYFLVMDFGDLKFAARWKGDKLSVRAEGTGFDTYKVLLNDAGLAISSNTHASVHVHAHDALAVNKVLGALAFAVGKPMLNPKPDPMKFRNKGQ